MNLMNLSAGESKLLEYSVWALLERAFSIAGELDQKTGFAAAVERVGFDRANQMRQSAHRDIPVLEELLEKIRAD